MKTFIVELSKTYYFTGKVEVKAKNKGEALRKAFKKAPDEEFKMGDATDDEYMVIGFEEVK